MQRWICYFVYILIIGCDSNYEMKYYEDGSIKWKARKRNGIYDGDFISFYPNGVTKTKGYWQNGIGNGYIERFFPSGKVQEKSHLKENEFHGRCELYHSNGKLKMLADYKNGCKINDYRVYSSDEKLIDRAIYNQHCELVYLAKFDSLGKKIIELVYPEFKIVEGTPNSVKVKLRFNLLGNKEIEIGIRDSDYFQPITEVVHLVDTSEHVINIPDSIDIDRLFYHFKFSPHISDSIPQFEFDKRLFSKPKIEKQSIDIAYVDVNR